MGKKMVGNIWKREYRSVIPHLSPLFFPLCVSFDASFDAKKFAVDRH